MLSGLAALTLTVAAPADLSAQESAYLGAMMAPLTANIQRDLAIKISKGVAIGDIVPGSPAAIAGLKGDDVVVGIDGRAVGSPRDVIAIISRHNPGDHIAVQILDSKDDHRAKTLSVTLGARPFGFQPDQQPGPQPVPAPRRPGVNPPE